MSATGHQARQVIGIDLGGTKILAGSTNAKGELLLTHQEGTETRSTEALIDQLVDITRILRDMRPLAQVVLGVPAAVDPATGALDLSPNVPLGGVSDLQAQLSARMRAPVTVENDANLAAYAEAVLGAGRGRSSISLLTFGTGIGMGTVIDGQILRGGAGLAGEIGTLPVGTPHGPQELEAQVGTPGILAQTGVASVRDLFKQALKDDQGALAALRDVAEQAALGLAAVKLVLDPDVLVIGGGIGTQPLFHDLLKQALSSRLPFETELTAAQLGANAGMIGAVALAARTADLPSLMIQRATAA